MSTLLTTAPTSVRASQNGLPVSRAISSANSASFLRTTLAKRRTASMRKATECAAHAGQAARAAATSAAASPISPDQISSPVAGLVEIRVRGTACGPRGLSASGQAAGASCSIASPIRRTAVTLSLNGCQSSRSAIADQIASTSSICIEQGRSSGPIWVRLDALRDLRAPRRGRGIGSAG